MATKNKSASSNAAKLDLLLQLTGQINSNLDLGNVLSSIIDAAKLITDSEACSVFLKDEQRNELILSVPSGPTADSISGKRISMEKGIAGWVASHSEAQIINHVAEDDRFHGDFDPDKFRTHNMICVPLVSRDNRVIGVLQAMNKKNGVDYSEEEIPVFRALADQAAIAINNAKLNEERNALMGEIHHRVRNNMATISAIMQLQMLQADNEVLQKSLLSNVTRISSMATIHNAMYSSKNFSQINFKDSLEKVVSDSLNTLGKRNEISVSYNCEQVILNVNQCIPLSMIINEMILKIVAQHNHEVNPGIEFILKEIRNDQKVRLEIVDNGTPITDQTKQDNANSFQFIEVIRQQINAEYTYKPGKNKNRFTITFKKSDKKGTANYGL